MGGLIRTSPAEVGLNAAALNEYLHALGGHGCHSVMVMRHGRVALEGWWKPYSKDVCHIAYSLSKSFVTVAVGFAVQEGLLSVSDRLVDFFPELLPDPPCENMRRVTVRDLLTMNMGHRGRTDHDFYRDPDWLENMLRLYLENVPGTNFFYDNRCTYLCSRIITKLTGLSVYDYLTPRLFEPLGMSGLWWEQTDGVNPGGWGLNLTTEHIARFGQFLLDRGSWDGKQLLNAEWIDTASSRLVENAGISVNDWDDWQQGYGYFIWQCVPDRVYRGDGAFGQFVIVAPEQDMVIAITAGTNRACDLLTDTWKMLDDAVDRPSDAALPELLAHAAALEIPPAAGEYTAPGYFPGGKYIFPKNEAGFVSLTLTPGDRDTLEIVTETGVFTAEAGHGEWTERVTGYEADRFSAMSSFLYSRAACCGAWDGEVYIIKLAFTETPYTDTMSLVFGPDCVHLKYSCDPYLPLRHGVIELCGWREGLFER